MTSLGCLSWALTSYHRLLRLSIPGKAKISYAGMALQFIWRIFTIGCRVLALALFASTLTYWVFVLAACHWFSMFFWLLVQNTSFCNPKMRCAKCQEVFFNMVVAAVYIYCYVNVSEGHTRLRYFVYYCIVYLENGTMCLLWYVSANTRDSWYMKPALALIFGGFFLGILFQLIYYKWWHPNNYNPYVKYKRIKTCLSIDELLNRKPRRHPTPSHRRQLDKPVSSRTAVLSDQV